MKSKTLFLHILLVILVFSCKNKQTETPIEVHKVTPNKKDMVEVNKYLVRKDAEKIDSYLQRRSWEMNQTKTGLYYHIYDSTNGVAAKKGMIATMNYKVFLLDGTLCYSSDEDGQKEFLIGKGGVESGLEQGILFMREGEKARFIMPPHLAHGLIGDENRIPARAIILYDIELVKLTNPN